MPDETKPTGKLPAIVAVQGTTLDGILTTLQTIVANQDNDRTLLTELRDDHDQLRRDFEERKKRESDRAAQPSEHDLAAQSELAKERAAREALARDLEANTEATKSLASKMDAHAEDVADIKADLAQNSESTEAVKNALVVTVTGLGTFLKAHKAEVAGLFAAACGWAAHWFATH
jgi:chromosome segregation ATPase